MSCHKFACRPVPPTQTCGLHAREVSSYCIHTQGHKCALQDEILPFVCCFGQDQGKQVLNSTFQLQVRSSFLCCCNLLIFIIVLIEMDVHELLECFLIYTQHNLNGYVNNQLNGIIRHSHIDFSLETDCMCNCLPSDLGCDKNWTCDGRKNC